MNIEKLSIKTVTTIIFMMIGAVAVILSLFAGSYFKQAALDAQINSLSRVIEVASQEIIRKVGQHTFELGMKLSHNKRLINALQKKEAGNHNIHLTTLLDDPFVSGFAGFPEVNLVKLRVYSIDLEFVSESSVGITGLKKHLPENIAVKVAQKNKTGRLKAIDALWLSSQGPLYSTLVPVGGLRSVGYLEIIVDPAFNLPDIGNITKTPINIFSITDGQIDLKEHLNIDNHLPVKFTLLTSDGKPAFNIVGYENVGKLSKEMEYTQVVTTSGFLILTISTLLFALWLFNQFLFVPLGRMVEDMNKISDGKLDLTVNKKGLREFSTFAETFESMANQIKIRTNDLERLLDLDDSAILCFGHDAEAIYFNKSASMLFGYMEDEISDLDMSDLFSEDIARLMKDSSSKDIVLQHNDLRARLNCIRKDGYVFQGDAVINPLETMSGFGYTIVLNPVVGEQDNKVPQYVASTIEKNEQRMRAVEQSLNSILEIASNNPGLISGIGNIEQSTLSGSESNDNKDLLREQIVLLMRSVMACWEHDIGKTKLALAEESKIWPVYIDKSTPTTRTLDKYLHIDSCPKNPRSQRVIDTAEFVLKQLGEQQAAHKKQLVDDLQSLRQLMSGI